MSLIPVDDFMFQACYGEDEPDPTGWRQIMRHTWEPGPYDIEGAAELAVENHLYDGADHPDCGYVEVWIKPMNDPEAWMLFRVNLEFDISFNASAVRPSSRGCPA